MRTTKPSIATTTTVQIRWCAMRMDIKVSTIDNQKVETSWYHVGRIGAENDKDNEKRLE